MVIIIVIFAAFFGAAALLLLVVMAPNSKEAKQTRSRLEQLRTSQSAFAAEESVDVRRIEQFSALPWLNTLLQKLDVFRNRLIVHR